MVQDQRDQRDVELVERLRDVLDTDEPTVRMDLVEAARERLASGPHPSALEVAGTVVAEFA